MYEFDHPLDHCSLSHLVVSDLPGGGQGGQGGHGGGQGDHGGHQANRRLRGSEGDLLRKDLPMGNGKNIPRRSSEGNILRSEAPLLRRRGSRNSLPRDRCQSQLFSYRCQAMK